MTRLLKAAAALLCACGISVLAPAQMTNVTAAANSLKISGAVISAGTVMFTPVDINGNPIPFETGGGGLNSPGAFSCSISNGALSGCSVPDSALTTPANLIYQVQISDTSTGNPTSGRTFTLQAVIGVTGTTWALDHYGPPGRTSNTQMIQASGGAVDPTGACTAPALYTNSATGGLFVCVNGAYVKVNGSGVAAAPATATSPGLVQLPTGQTSTQLATVAVTGSYNDLSNKPTGGGGGTVSAASASAPGSVQLATGQTSSTLAAVATTGAYGDLTGKPTTLSADAAAAAAAQTTASAAQTAASAAQTAASAAQATATAAMPKAGGTFTGAITAPKLNATTFVATTIQAAVSAACTTGYGKVTISPGVTPTDTPGAVTGGCSAVLISDESGGQGSATIYTWNGTAYVKGGAGNGTTIYGQDVRVPSTLPTGMLSVGAGLSPTTGNPLSFYLPNAWSTTLGGLLFCPPQSTTLDAQNKYATQCRQALAGTDYAAPNANSSGTAANLSGTPTLPTNTKVATGTAGAGGANAASQAYADASSAAAQAAALNLETVTAAKLQPGIAGLYFFDANDGAGVIHDHSGLGNDCTYPTSGTGFPTMTVVGSKPQLTWGANTNQSNGMSCPGITSPATMQAVWTYVQPATKYVNYARTPFGYSTATNSPYFYESQYSFTPAGGPYVPPYVYNLNGASFIGMPSGNGSNLLTLSYSPTGNSYFFNSQQFVPVITATNTTPPTGGNLEIGMCHNSSCLGYNAPYNMAISFLVVYQNTALSGAQALANVPVINEYMADNGVALGSTVANSTLTPVPYNVVCDLTSIDAGTGSGRTACMDMTLGSNYTTHPAAIASDTLGHRLAENLLLERSLMNPQAANILVLDGPVTNDLCASQGTVSSALQAWSLIAASISLAKQYGFAQVGVGTMISRGGNTSTLTQPTTCDALKNQVNALIRQNVNAAGGFLFDMAAFPGFGADGAYANPTSPCGSTFNSACYVGDQTHPTAAGEFQFALYEQNVIQANTGFNATTPNSQAGTSYAMTTADRYLLNPITAASTRTLPDCIGLTGYSYQMLNTSASFVITVSGLTGEAVAGSTTIAAGASAIYTVALTSPATGGCSWLRTQ